MKNPMRMLLSACLVSLLLISFYSSAINLPRMSKSKTGNDFSDQVRNSTNAEPATDLEMLAERGIDPEHLLNQQAELSLESAQDGNGTYDLIWEPNRIQGSVHSVAAYAGSVGGIVAIGAGYLYDNEIHVYRWNASVSGEAGLAHVGDLGEGLFKSDVLSLAIWDTDRDNYIEIAAGCADGRIYAFEQKTNAYPDPSFFDFQLVWNSSSTEIGWRVPSIAIDDLDNDGLYEIIAGAWSQKIYIFEYSERYATPGSPSHRHYYTKVWDSGEAITGLVNSIATGDTDSDTLREIVVGASDNRVYIFENGNSTSSEPAYPHLDNSYSLVWNSQDNITGSVNSVAISNSVDTDEYGEIVAVSSGHGAFVFDYAPSTGDYAMNKLMRDVESWEKDAPFPIDQYVDLKVWGTNEDGVFEPGETTTILEPIPEPYSYLEENATAMAGPPDSVVKGDYFLRVTLLNATSTLDGSARVLLDFGKDQELTGGGTESPDLYLYGLEVLPANVTLNDLRIFLSQDGMNFSRAIDIRDLKIKKSMVEHNYGKMLFEISIDADPILNASDWEWFRYVKLETTKDVYIDALEGLYLYRPISDAQSITIGWLPGLNTTNTDRTKKIIIGTTTGTIKVFASNSSSPGNPYSQIWDSYKAIPRYHERFSMNNTIWSISLAPTLTGSRYIVVGTYPKVALLSIDAETWATSVAWGTGNVLAKWTMTVDLADTDGDGKEEVIVGSFDNNVYIFDHVFRNTYRRAWRSPDLMHNETYWDHVTSLVAGDYDTDSKIELVASTDDQTYPMIYVFKNIGENRFTLSDPPIELPKNSGPVSAMTIGDDLDKDTYKELIVATSKNFTVLEKKGSILTWSSYAILAGTNRGTLTSLVTGDSDKDSRGEIIIGGYNQIGTVVLINSGFVLVYENDGTDNKYQLVWQAPSEHTTYGLYFKVLSLALDDQDKDDKMEIIVGHTLGINIYKNNGDNAYAVSQFVTSSASYPLFSPTQATTLPDNWFAGGSNAWEGWTQSAAPVVQLSNGTYVMVYTDRDTAIDHTRLYWNEGRLFYKTSQDGKTWSSRARVTNDNQYNPATDYWLYYERNPSTVAIGNSVWIAYETKFVEPSGGIDSVPVVDNNLWICVTKLGTPEPGIDLNKVAYKAVSPSIFQNITEFNLFIGSGTLGLTYLNYTAPLSGRNMLYLQKSTWTTYLIGFPSRFYTAPLWKTAELQNNVIGAEFQAYSQESLFLKDGSLAVVFAGYNRTNTERTDSDIWFITTNGSDTAHWSKPRWISLSTDSESTPSIAELKGNVLAVVYRKETPNWRVYMTASSNNGSTWTKPQQLPATGQDYAPSISGLTNGGFMYSFHTSTATTTPTQPRIYIGQNPVQNWWQYTIGPVQSLVTGDTDNDQTREIIAGSLNQILILEYASSGIYTQKWTSQSLPQPITDIALGDINGDGAVEIIVTAKSGNVYAFKWTKQQ